MFWPMPNGTRTRSLLCLIAAGRVVTINSRGVTGHDFDHLMYFPFAVSSGDLMIIASQQGEMHQVTYMMKGAKGK